MSLHFMILYDELASVSLPYDGRRINLVFMSLPPALMVHKMNDGATKSKMRLQLVRSNHGRSLSDIESM
jgi:hypothetical protein